MNNGKTDSHASFLRAIEQYYGSFSTAFKRGTILTYLRENFVPEKLHDLWTLLVQQYSSQYKTPPDIAVIERVWNDAHPNEQPYPYAGGNIPIENTELLKLMPPERTDKEILSVKGIVKEWKTTVKEKEMAREHKGYYYPDPGDDLYTRCLKKVRRMKDEIKEEAPF